MFKYSFAKATLALKKILTGFVRHGRKPDQRGTGTSRTTGLL